jgi:sec-independent protein translocase protein TatA
MFGAIGMPELVIVSVIALMVFGPANFPDFGKSLGTAIRGFEKTVSDAGECILERSASPTPLNRGARLWFVP